MATHPCQTKLVDWLLCLNCLLSCSALALVCNFDSTDANRKFFLTLNQLINQLISLEGVEGGPAATP